MLDLEEIEATFARLIVPWVMRRPGRDTSVLDPLLARVPQDGFHTNGSDFRGQRERRGKNPETQRKNNAAYRRRHHYREIIRRRAYREREKVSGMTQIEVYDALVPFISEPAVFQYRDGDCVVGRWVPSAEAGSIVPISEVGAWDRYVLRGKAKAVLVLGRGASWEEAYEHARAAIGAP